MRNFDNHDTYHDNIGDVLIGRVKFCDTERNLSTVKDVDGNVIDSIQYTDSAGRIKSQVFLEDHDYIVIFEKFVGESMADMESDDEEDSWEPQFETTSLYKIFSVDVGGEGSLQCVTSIAELRTLDPSTVHSYNGKRIVTLLGYYTAGDASSVNYIWDESNVDGDDNGSVIKVDGIASGRWTIIYDGGNIDVKHFGVFPNSTCIVDLSQRLSIQMAMQYANKLGVGLYFSSTSLANYYDISLCTLNMVSCTSDVRFYCMSGNDALFTNVDEVYVVSSGAYSGNVKIYGRKLSSKFNIDNSSNVTLIPSEIITLDTDYAGSESFSGVEVIVNTNQTHAMSFDNCTFSGTGLFTSTTGPFYFKNCHIRESMFLTTWFDSTLWNDISFTNCYSNFDDWTDVDRYIDWCVMNQYSTLDIAGKTSSKAHWFHNSVSISNCNFNAELSVSGSVFVGPGCKISSLDLRGNRVENIVLNSCDVTFSSTYGDIKVNNFNASNSIIRGDASIRTNTPLIDSCTIYDTITLCGNDNTVLVLGTLTNNTFADGITPTISEKSIDGLDFDDLITVDGLIVQNNIYLGNKRSPLLFTANVMSSTQGQYIVKDNSNTTLDSTFDGTLHLSGTIQITDRAYIDSSYTNTDCYVDAEPLYNEGVATKYATFTIKNFKVPVFSFGESTRDSKEWFSFGAFSLYAKQTWYDSSSNPQTLVINNSFFSGNKTASGGLVPINVWSLANEYMSQKYIGGKRVEPLIATFTVDITKQYSQTIAYPIRQQ